MNRNLCLVVGVFTGLAGYSPLWATDFPILLNYNFNGMVHTGESGSPDAANGYRSMSDRGMLVTGAAGNFGTNPIVGATCLPYTIVTTPGFLDMVHLGNRNSVSGGEWAFDVVVDGDNIGIQPTWLLDPDQTGPQTTTIAPPIVLDATAEIGVIYNITNGGGFFDITLDFTDLSTATVTIHGPDWFQNQSPVPPGFGAWSQAQVGVFTGTGSTDRALADAPLNIAEAVLSVPKLLADGFGDFSGKSLSAVTFSNRQNLNAGYGIYAATVRTGITPPAHDECATCTTVTEGVTLSTSAGATGTDISTCGSNDHRDVWFCYTPAQNGLAVVRLTGSAFNTTAAVYDGCGGAEVACNDDSDGVQAVVSWAATANTPYKIRVAGVNNSGCDIRLTVQLTVPPANDDCTNCIPIVENTPAQGTTIGSNLSAGSSCVGSDTFDVWYCYQASQTGNARASLCGSTFDTTVAIYDACGGNELACNDDSAVCGGVASSVNWAVTANTTYYIRVSGWNGATGDFTIVVANPGEIFLGPVSNPVTCSDYYLLIPSTWTAAEANAVAMFGAHLATVNDAAENTWIRDNIVGPTRSAWIGFNDVDVEGTFVWVSGEPVTYTNWNPGEPNNAGGLEHYTQFIGAGGGWNDNSDVAGGGVQVWSVVEVSGMVVSGDLDCNCQLTFADVQAFALALVDPTGYGIQYPGCQISRADVNGDTVADGRDISAFVDLLVP